MEDLAFEIKSSDKYDLIILSGEINTKNHESFLQEVDKSIKYNKIIILNLKYLQYIDSIGVYALMTIIKNLKKNNLHLYVFNMNDKIKEIFKLVGLTKYLKEINSASVESFFIANS